MDPFRVSEEDMMNVLDDYCWGEDDFYWEDDDSLAMASEEFEEFEGLEEFELPSFDCD